MRELRKASGFTLRTLATRMGFSAPYISDLELGRRGWSSKLQEGYRKHCEGTGVLALEREARANAKLCERGEGT